MTDLPDDPDSPVHLVAMAAESAFWLVVIAIIIVAAWLAMN